MTREEIGAILKQLRISCGMTQKEVAEKLGRKQQIVGHWETGYSQPDANTLFTLCELYGASIDDAFGFTKKNIKIEPCEFDMIKKYRSLDSTGKEHVDTLLQWESDRMSQMQTPESSSHRRVFAYYGKIAAAGISYGFEDIISGTKEYPETDENQNADYTIGISGNSMEPTYYDGDIVYVAKTYHLDIGDIGIFQKDNGIYIKEVGEGGLISHNPDFEMLVGDDVKCLGKVIGIAERG